MPVQVRKYPGSSVLKDNWMIRSSAEVTQGGTTLSVPGYVPENWYPAPMPSTVFGALVGNNLYPDPYFGTNIESVPGYFTRRGGEIPDDSPFKPAWWYRTKFSLPADYRGMNTWIKLHSINYQANIWLNGQLIADTSEISVIVIQP
jgi:exo-1,4-beta-D-glucosaminidase